MSGTARRIGRAETLLEPAAWGPRFIVRGDVGRQELAPVVAALFAQDTRAASAVALCDYTRADMAVAARYMMQAHRRVSAGKPWATALVVPPAQLQLWKDYAYLQGQRGHLRGVFTALEPAERWIAELAAVLSAQARHRLRDR